MDVTTGATLAETLMAQHGLTATGWTFQIDRAQPALDSASTDRESFRWAARTSNQPRRPRSATPSSTRSRTRLSARTS